MERWYAFGKFVSRNMGLLTLGCVAFGILFPSVLLPVKPYVTLLFAIITFQGALGNTFESILGVLRKPRLLLVILLVSSVAIPSVARVVGDLFYGDDPDILAGIVMEFCVPIGVVSVMWSGLAGGNPALAIVSVFVSTVISPIALPFMMSLLLGEVVAVDTPSLIRTTLFMIAIPAVAGVTVNDLTHGWGAKRLSPVIAPACRVLVLLVIATNSTGISEFMFNLTPRLVGVIVLIFVLALVGYATGYVLGKVLGDSHADAATMCIDCGFRNITAGAVVAASYFPAATMFPVMAGTLFQQILAAVIAARLAKMGEGEAAASE